MINLTAMQETWFQSLGCQDPPEKGMATHSSILAWEIPWTKEPSRQHKMHLTEALGRVAREVISVSALTPKLQIPGTKLKIGLP